MLKEKRQLFELLFVIADIAVVSIAWILAYWLRFNLNLIPVEKGVPPFSNYYSMLLFIWLIWAFVYKRAGLYRPMRGVRRIKEIWLLINANFFALIIFIAVTYLFREKSVPFSRLVFVYFGILATILSIIERLILRTALREIRRRGYNLRYMIIVGSGELAGEIASRIRLHKELGIQLLGCLAKDKSQKRGSKGIPIIGTYNELSSILKEFDIDQVIIALPLEDNMYLQQIMEQLGDSLVDVRIVPDISRFITFGGSIEEFEGLPVISVRESPIEGINLIAKRTLDISVATIALVLLSPLMIVIAILIKLTSKGPIFYKQERISVDGSSFQIIKFRTMQIDAEANGPGWTKPNDKRTTRIGSFLRKWSLDELPQLINVLKGDMSLVGPRPERPVFIKVFKTKIPKYMLRHKVPAGMTGWAQINGWRGDTAIDKRIEYDLYYIENWSLLFDLKILALTLIKGLKSKNAY